MLLADYTKDEPPMKKNTSSWYKENTSSGAIGRCVLFGPRDYEIDLRVSSLYPRRLYILSSNIESEQWLSLGRWRVPQTMHTPG